MARYTFEFISVYQGETSYRLYIDGKSDTRISTKNRKCYYSDKSPLLPAKLKAFNDMKRAEHEDALAKYPDIGEFIPYHT